MEIIWKRATWAGALKVTVIIVSRVICVLPKIKLDVAAKCEST